MGSRFSKVLVAGLTEKSIRGSAVTAFSNFDLVGYENGDPLAAALEAGFQTVGDLTVWKRA